MAAMTKLWSNVYRTLVPRRTFTTGRVLRDTPPGIPNDTMPFLFGKEKTMNKPLFTVAYVMYIGTALMWPIMAFRDQCIRIGSAVEDPTD